MSNDDVEILAVIFANAVKLFAKSMQYILMNKSIKKKLEKN